MYDPPSFIRPTIRSVFFCFVFFDIRLLNSLSLKSDWNLSSPYSIIAESTIKGYENTENHQRAKEVKCCDCQTYSPCQYHMKSKENSVEKKNFNIRVLRINTFASLA